MMKEEFEKLVGKEVSVEDFTTIGYVYTWHPAISNTEGKKQIADIFNAGGMAVIEGMVEVTDYMMKLQSEELELKAKLDAVARRKKDVENGYIFFEQCIKAVEEAYDASNTAGEFDVMLKIARKTYGFDMVTRARETLKV